MDPNRIAAICHIYYPELWPELAGYLRNLPDRCRILVTLSGDRAAGMEEQIRRDFPRAEFRPLPNKGRDTVPFLRVLPDLAGQGVELVCKVHTKQGSAVFGDGWREHGRIWREIMLESMLATPEWVDVLLEAFQNHPKLGMAGPDRLFASAAINLYDNHPNIEALWRRLPFERNLPSDWGFFAGSMFWARVKPLLPLARAIEHFRIEEENDKPDGQTAHALERMFGLMIREAGLSVGLVDVRRLRSKPGSALRLTKPPHRVVQREVRQVLQEIAKKGDHLPLPPPGFQDRLLREIQRPWQKFAANLPKPGPKSGPPNQGSSKSGSNRDPSGEVPETKGILPGYQETWRQSSPFPMICAPYSKQEEDLILDLDRFRKARVAQCQASTSEEAMVSVILPTYNRGHCLGRAIESVLAQTWDNWELWIIDDASTDDTTHVAESYQDPRIHYHRLDHNAGPAAARNVALGRAGGRFICYLESDKLFKPDFLQLMVRELEACPRFDAVYCAQRIWMDCGKLDCRELGIRFGAFHGGRIDDIHTVDLATVMHRRELLERYGFFNETMRQLESWDFLLRISIEKPFRPVPLILSEFRCPVPPGP